MKQPQSFLIDWPCITEMRAFGQHVKSTETVRTVRDGEPRTATSTFTQLPSSMYHGKQTFCLTATEAIRLIRDG